jgi:hypothetical protein
MPHVEDDRLIAPFSNPAVGLNRIMRVWGHQFIWDFDTMQRCLSDAGFTDIRQRSFGEGADPKLAVLDTESRKEESLYVEAQNPT